MEERILVNVTKKNNCSIWETGGMSGTNGFARIIATEDCSKKKCIFENRNRIKNGDHALFILSEGDMVITCKVDEVGQKITFSKVMKFEVDKDTNNTYAIAEIVWAYDGKEWSVPCEAMKGITREQIEYVVETVVSKAKCVDCEATYFVLGKK